MSRPGCLHSSARTGDGHALYHAASNGRFGDDRNPYSGFDPSWLRPFAPVLSGWWLRCRVAGSSEAPMTQRSSSNKGSTSRPGVSKGSAMSAKSPGLVGWVLSRSFPTGVVLLRSTERTRWLYGPEILSVYKLQGTDLRVPPSQLGYKTLRPVICLGCGTPRVRLFQYDLIHGGVIDRPRAE
jgi:hypothetical protein